MDPPVCVIHGWLKLRFVAAPRAPIPGKGQIYAVQVWRKGYHHVVYTTGTLSRLWSLSTLTMFICMGLMMIMLAVFVLGRRRFRRWSNG